MIPTKKEILINEYMKDILETHPVANLKAILRKMKQEVGSYSKMKKAELINRIMELKRKGFPVPKVEKYVKPKDPKKINISKSGTQSVLKPAPTIYQNRSKLLKSYETGDKEMTEKSFKVIKTRIEDAFELEEITKNQKNLLLRRLKKLEPKKPEPKKPEPKPNKFSGMTEEQNIQYIKKILRKKPKNSDTKAIKEFLEAHKDFFNELDKTKFFNDYSNKDKFKFLRLYINKTIPQLREELAYRGTMMSETKGMNKSLLINFLI